MQKMKAGNLSGMEKHNKRIFQNHSNPDIDTSLSDQNYDLMNREGKYKDIVTEIIESQKISQRATRKDAVLVSEWIITSDQAFFKNMDPNERDRFFQEATDWFKERYGEQNLAYAHVHLDETTPHMHLGVVPMRDGKLQAKNVFNREELRHLQDELPKHLREKGFEIDRGAEESERKHLSIPEYKKAMESVKELDVERQKKSQEIIKTVSQIDELQSAKSALQDEYEAHKAIVNEFKQRGKGLVETTKKLVEKPPYKAPEVESIFQPEVSDDFLGKNVKMKKEDYSKMIESQNTSLEKHKILTNRFDLVAETLEKANRINYQLSAELEKAKKAIPVQTDDFVSKTEHEKIKRELKISEQRHEQKDFIIQQQQVEIKDLKQIVNQFKMVCIDFIKEKRHQAFDLMSDLAKKLHLVKDVNESIKQDKEREQEKSRHQDDSEMEL
ncbi:hypothetical protein JOD43_004474 [Pullulanibacillus pueri]|nr:hypothetical protein [Pullulanibacillus pueri]